MRRSHVARLRCARALAVGVLALLATTALAQQTAQRAMRERVAQLPVAQRDAYYRREAMLRAMTAAQRAEFEKRVAAWHALPDAQRRQQRERWQAWQALSPSERVRIETAAAQFAGLPVREQLDLRARHAQLDEAERRGWLLGPTLGADWAGLQPLLMQVPEQQRDALLEALRAMSAQQRADLAVLAQRTPPQARARLRADLLATPAGQRGAWMLEQLER